MAPWTCRCGIAGDAVTDEDAQIDWLLHANIKGCSHLRLSQLRDAVARSEARVG